MDVPGSKVFMKAGRSNCGSTIRAEKAGAAGMPPWWKTAAWKMRVYPPFADLKEPSGYFPW